MNQFKHALGSLVKAKVTGLTGMLVNRSEALYGCNRYLVQPPVQKDNKIPEAWWVDEDDIEMVKEAVVEQNHKRTGAPMSKKA